MSFIKLFLVCFLKLKKWRIKKICNIEFGNLLKIYQQIKGSLKKFKNAKNIQSKIGKSFFKLIPQIIYSIP